MGLACPEIDNIMIWMISHMVFNKRNKIEVCYIIDNAAPYIWN